MRQNVLIALAGLVALAVISSLNVHAQSTNIQSVCLNEYQELIDQYESQKWRRVREMAVRVRECADDGSLSKERIEYTYVVELHAIGELDQFEAAFTRAKEIADGQRIVERRDFMGFVFSEAALAAYHLGKSEESLHFFNLALYHSESRSIEAQINLRRSLYLLQKRNREYESAGKTIDEIKMMLAKHEEHLSAEDRLVTYTMISRYHYGRLIPRVRGGATSIDTTKHELATLWNEGRLYHRQSRAILTNSDLADATRDDLAYRVRLLDIDVARLLGQRSEVTRLLAEWRRESRELGKSGRLLQALAVQARVEMDAGAYETALGTIKDLEEAAKGYQLPSFMPVILSYRVRIASHSGDRVTAKRALNDLANFEGSVPTEIFREASGLYASVFQSTTTSTSLPDWMLLCLALGVAGTLQYIAVTRGRNQENKLLQAFTSPLKDLARNSHWDLPHAMLGKPKQQGKRVSAHPGIVAQEPTTASTGTQRTSAEPGGDGVSFAAEDAVWLREAGIAVQDMPEIDSPPEIDRATLEDLLKQSLDGSTRIRCFGPDGAKTDDMPLPTHVIEHATSDRFIGIDLGDRLLIVYRYARPQHTMVKQDETGALRIVQLDTPVTAVPIASIQKEA